MNPSKADDIVQRIDFLCRLRSQTHIQAANRTARLYEDELIEERVGAAGEVHFAIRYGLKENREAYVHGDTGIDFETRAGTVGVKTYRPNSPFNLLVKPSELSKLPKILVLAKYFNDLSVEFLKWDWTNDVKRWQRRASAVGKFYNYFKPPESMLDLVELERRMGVSPVSDWDGEVKCYCCPDGISRKSFECVKFRKAQTIKTA